MEDKKQVPNAPDTKDNASDANVPPDQEIHGRLYNSKNPEFKDKDSKDDISHVDKQEGTMNRGATGGEGDKERM